MTDAVDTIERAGCSVELHYDTEPYNPRGDDQLGTMACWHPRYELGDKQFGHDDYPNARSMSEVAQAMCRDENIAVMLPLVLLDHGGITIRVGNSFSADPGGWDTTQVGFIFATWDSVRTLGVSTDLRQIEKSLRAEVAEYDSYLTGDVYGYVAYDRDGARHDSCWGFIGLEYAREAAEEALGEVVAAADDEAREVAHWAARGVRTVVA